jgi:hypothetical protein
MAQPTWLTAVGVAILLHATYAVIVCASRGACPAAVAAAAGWDALAAAPAPAAGRRPPSARSRASLAPPLHPHPSRQTGTR